MTAKSDLEKQISDAFGEARQPATERALAPPSIEAKYVIEHFFGRTRSDINAKTLLPSLHLEDFMYMTHEGVAYYLPPVLLLMLDEPHDYELWIYLSGFLGSVRHDYMTSLRALSPAQHEAIARWADFLATTLDGTLGRDPKKAAKLARRYRELAKAAR